MNIFQQIMERIILTASPKVFEELLKYRKHIIKRYNEEVENLIESSKNAELMSLSERYLELEKKYQDTNKESKYRFS